MPTLPNMGLITPTLGGDSGAWDDKINACFALVDAHDHTAGKGVRITPAAMNINANLSFGGFAITAAGQVAFTAVAALTSGAKTIFVSSADNELYWRTNAGVNVKLTNGTSINTTLVGGIVGDYSTVGAEVSYSNADQIYTFKDHEAPTKKWARLGAGPVRIFEFDTTESVYVEHAVAAGLAAPYTVTWAAALPGAQSLVQIDASGNLVYSNTLPANTNITLSGTGSVKHGDYKLEIPVIFPLLVQESGAGAANNGANAGITIDVSSVVYIPLLGIPQNKRLKSVTVRLESGGLAANVTYQLAVCAGGVFTAVGSSTASTSSVVTVTPDGSNGWGLGDGDSFWLKITTPGATGCVPCSNNVTFFEN